MIEQIKRGADPNCLMCHGVGIVWGETHEVIPSQPGAVWWKDNDRVCACVPRIEYRVEP